MMEEFGKFDDLKENFSDSVFDPDKKEEFLALSPTHLVVQPSKEDHKIRTTLDYSNLNGLFSRGKYMLPHIYEKVAELRSGKYIVALDVSRQYFQAYTMNPNTQCML